MQLSDRIGRRMKLQDLHVLMTVVQTGSMKKAAALLTTSQPAISRSIAELERSVGVRLLDRAESDARPFWPRASFPPSSIVSPSALRASCIIS